MNWKRLAAVAAAFTLLTAACGGGGSTATSSGSDGLSGSVNVSGSSTVEPITARNAEKFAAANPGVAISVEGPGTGDGFKLFCGGETDISDASRAIKDAEAAACADNGIDYIELHIAIDGLSVLTSVDNSAVTCLAFEDLYALLGPESLGFDNWSDADALAAELGGANHAPYPDAPLVITAPGEESGTYDTFIELALEDQAEERSQDPTTRPDYQASANDNVIIQGIAGSDTSLGWVGYAFFLANQDVVKAIEIDGGSGCVAPTAATIANGSYPLARPLYIYVNTQKAEDKPEVAAFVDSYLSEDGLGSIDETGYVRLADYQPTRGIWEGR